VGRMRYAGRRDKELIALLREFPRQALHAAPPELEHPWTAAYGLGASFA